MFDTNVFVSGGDWRGNLTLFKHGRFVAEDPMEVSNLVQIAVPMAKQT